MKDSRFIGTGVAIVTPFRQNEVDYEGLTGVIEHVISGGVDYIVALGSTGEAATISAAEERSILDHVIATVDGRLPIVAGDFGHNHTMELREKIAGFNFDGIAAILSSSPAYVKPSQEGIYQHYMAIEEVCPVPIILYNVPGRTRSNMEWQTTVRLAEASRKFIGIKEATGDLIQASRIIKNKPDHFFVTSGDDEVALPMVAAGGDGVISVIANAYPQAYSAMIRFALGNCFEEARRYNFATYDLHKWLYIEGNPVGIKSAMEVLGICGNGVRLPLAPLSRDNYEQLAAEMKRTDAQLQAIEPK